MYLHSGGLKETTLERAAFLAGWSKLSWSGRTQPVLSWILRDNSWQKLERKKIVNILLSFSAVTNINSWRAKSALSNEVSLGGPTDTFKIAVLRNPSIGKCYALAQKRRSRQIYPTGPFTALELENQAIVEFYEVALERWLRNCERVGRVLRHSHCFKSRPGDWQTHTHTHTPANARNE